MSVRTPSWFMWGGKYKENLMEVERIFNNMDRNDMVNRRKILLVERENIFRELALIKFRKSVGSDLMKAKNSQDMEILRERLQELTEKLKREFHLYPVEMKREASSVKLKGCQKTDSNFTKERQDFTFLVRGVSLHISSHRERNVCHKTNDINNQKKEEKARIMPPLKLPSIHHCQRERGLPALRENEQRKWRESKGTESGGISSWEDLVDCRYLRVYMPKNEGK